ncbi:MAG TPA: HTTM domain-containing protein [Dehalococcoidia bacterium]|nr:HTTM domain-containing protein [Dehalococcoidia bacterium]
MTSALEGLAIRWFQPVPAERLALLRIAIGGYALLYLLVRFANLNSYGSFEDSQFDAVGPVALLSEPLDGSVVTLLLLATMGSGIAFVAGWRFALTGPLFAVLLLWVISYRNSFGQIFHTENLVVLSVLILALAPSADSHSLDERIERTHARVDDGYRYGWAVRLICLVTVLAYVVAGLTKLQNAGTDWLTGDVLRNYVAYDNLRKIELGDVHSPLGAWMVSYGWMFPPLALFSVAVELGAPLALLGGRTTRIWIAAAWIFHVGILAVMAIMFPYQLLGIAFLPFLPVEQGWQRLRTTIGNYLPNLTPKPVPAGD